MRIYELSKQLGVPAKELLAVLHQKGIFVKSHMSVIDADAVAFLQNKFGAQKKTEPKKPVESKTPTQTKQEPMQTDTQRRTSHKPSRTTRPEYRPSSPSSRLSNIEQSIPQKATEIILEPMTVSDVAQKLGVSVNDVIITLLGWRLMVAKNQLISEDMVGRLALHYGVAIAKPVDLVKEELPSLAVEETGALEERLPVIVVLGHVDHGKTTLLDFIRKTRVVAKEKGGITQHLGAYEATTTHGNLVFLDTPGHEAFPKMRQRGVRVADIGILVIAAEDGIMPQTIEAIKQLKKMGIPIIVAINKIDKANAVQIERVKRQLADQDMLPEEWGGQTICIQISALHGTGVDQLLEMVALQAEMLELRASRTGDARGFVLESKLERGRGPVATVILQSGTLRVGDYFVCGTITGRVSSIKNSFDKVIAEAGPSIPILVAGFNELPAAGDLLRVVAKDVYRRDKQQERVHTSFASQAVTDDVINLIIKTDTNSSKEAVTDALSKLSKKRKIGFSIVYAGVGDINESDIELAYNTGALLIGLHVKAESNARSFARRCGVEIDLYTIIYKLLEALEERAEKAKPVETVRTKIGEATVRRVFDIKGVGVIAGSYIQDGRFSKDGYVVGWRGKTKIGEGKITSLQRDKKTVKEVHAGYECGFVVEGVTDWEVDDRIECFINVPK